MLDNSSEDISKEISLTALDPDNVGQEAFYLTDFYFDQNDFNRLTNKDFFLLLYDNETDSVARIGIEVKDKSYFKESFTMNRRILVDANGSMYQVDIKMVSLHFLAIEIFFQMKILRLLWISTKVLNREVLH